MTHHAEHHHPVGRTVVLVLVVGALVALGLSSTVHGALISVGFVQRDFRTRIDVTALGLIAMLVLARIVRQRIAEPRVARP